LIIRDATSLLSRSTGRAWNSADADGMRRGGGGGRRCRGVAMILPLRRQRRRRRGRLLLPLLPPRLLRRPRVRAPHPGCCRGCGRRRWRPEPPPPRSGQRRGGGRLLVKSARDMEQWNGRVSKEIWGGTRIVGEMRILLAK
jgi:hypothetical protein